MFHHVVDVNNWVHTSLLGCVLLNEYMRSGFSVIVSCYNFFFFQAEDGIRDLTVTGVQTCALPISIGDELQSEFIANTPTVFVHKIGAGFPQGLTPDFALIVDLGRRSGVAWPAHGNVDRKSTRLNSSHSQISYAVFCLKKKSATTRS